MSNFGPPSGPRPGQPQDPWAQPQAEEPYGVPSDPWGGQDAWGDAPSSTPPDGPGSPTGLGAAHVSPASYGPGGYPPTQSYEPGSARVHHAPVWTPAAPAPARKSNAAIIAIVAVLTVLVLGGGAVAVYLLGQDGEKPTAGSTAGPTGGPSEQPSASGQPRATTPAPRSSTNIRLVKAGDCVQNEGTDEAPRLIIVECAPKTYEVLRRVDGVIIGDEDADAERKCANVAGYTNFYYSNDALDELDFVLCLRKR